MDERSSLRTPRRSRRLRVLALAAGLAPFGIAATVESCVLADPPPQLETILPSAPLVQWGSVVPPQDSIITNWLPGQALEFVVPIQIDLDTSFYVFLDYGTVISTLVTPNPVTPNVAEPGLDAGGIQGINITMDPPSPGSCHTITFFAALKDVDPLFSLDPVSPASLTYTSALCSVLTWTYDPTGAGNCPTIDAGGISDADIRRPEAEASTPRDALADLLFMLDVRGQ